jgi:hypothetical protein
MRLSVRRGRPWNHDLGAGTSGPIISGYHAASHVPAVHKDGRVGAVTSISRSTMPSYMSPHGDNATSPQTGHTRHQPGHQLLPPGELMDTDSVQPHNDGDRSLEIYQMDDLSLNTNNAEAGTRQLSNASLISGASSQARRKRGTPFLQAWKTFTARLEAWNTRIADRIRKSRYHGWRMGVLVGCCTSAFVLCCNIAIVIVASQARGGYKNDGIADLIIGSATATSNWSTTAHLVINIFSTMLLGASNYTMQVLSSPTRKDIDRAHARVRWLDIGLLSTRNLWNIPTKRSVVWCLLAASSIPLHLL